MARGQTTTREWGERYARIRPHHEALTEEMSRLLKHILDHEDLEPAQVEARTKEVSSFTDKIERKERKYDDPLEEITDMTGLRVIVYYMADVARVGEIIEREFEVDWGNSVRQGADTDPDRFGYRSDHYVVSLARERVALAEWQQFNGYKAEIQVRTVMQHAWAAVDHKIRYKRTSLPDDLQRRLSRLSALLEVADEQFAAVHVTSRALSASYAASVASGDLDVTLDALSLRAYLDDSGLLERWERRALNAGFLRLGADRDSNFIELRTQDVLTALENTGIRDLAAVDALYRSAESWGTAALRTMFGAIDEHGATPLHLASEDVLELLALYRGRKARAVDRSRWGPKVKASLKAVIRAAR